MNRLIKTTGTASVPRIEVCWGDDKVQKSFWESLKYFLMTGKWVKEFVFKCGCSNHKN